jgi:beta-glucosidase
MTDRATELAAAMSLEEQVSLLSGVTLWATPAIPRLGINALRVTDGPNGARGGGSLIGGVKSAAFPVGIALGATWNRELVGEIGAALAEEVQSKGAQVSLAPTVNIQRSVTNGRNFECYSEDPILTGELASAYIRGMQGKGISATIKHFVGNESEIERTTMSSEIDERTLRELYLIPFEWAVKKAGTWGIMSSYNRLNGTFTSENEWLLTTVLRQQWGYTGIVMSDWFGSHTTAETINAGLDLEMPGPPRDRGQKLIDAVNAGEISAAVVAERAKNMLRLLERVGALDGVVENPERADDRPAHRALIRRAGADGAVLLANNGILPLGGSKTAKLAVIGPNAKTAQIMGGGSAQLNPHYSVSPYQGLATALGEDRLVYAEGCTNHRFEPMPETPFEVEVFASHDFSGPVVHRLTLPQAQGWWSRGFADNKVEHGKYTARATGSFTPPVSGTYNVGIFSAGLARVLVNGQLAADAWSNWRPGRTYFEEGCDPVVAPVDLVGGKSYAVVIEFASRPHITHAFSAFQLGIGLPLGDADIAAAVEAARGAETAVLFVGRSGQWDTEGSDLLDIRLPGRQDELVEAVAAANPNTVVVLQTGGPVEMPWLSKVAAVLQAWYPGQEAGNSIADVLLGKADPGGRLPQTFPARWADNPTQSQDREVYPGLNGKVRYEEGVFVGYRHYDKHGIKPLFPFGFGLSFTQFALGGLSVDSTAIERDGSVRVTATVTNTGMRAGSTVVQVYVGDEASSLPRPFRELKGFEKLALAVGESRVVTVVLDARSFAFFDPAVGQWKLEAGRFSIGVGFSTADIRLSETIERRETALLGL